MYRLLLLLPLLAAACADPGATSAQQSAVQIGRSEAELVAALGVPDRTYETEGRRFLVYEPRGGGGGPAVVPSIGFGVGRSSGGWGSATGFGTGLGLSFGGFGGAPSCSTTYELRDGRVIGATQQGPGCG